MEDWRGLSKTIVIENFEVYDKDDDMGKTTSHYITQLTRELEQKYKDKNRFKVEIKVTVYAK